MSDLDCQTLTDYFVQHASELGSVASLEKFSGGQSNPTYLMKTSSGQYVLRRQPFGKLLKSAHAVDREYRVLSALGPTNVPVAKTYHLCEDPSVIGSMFYVMEFVEGRILWDSALPKETNTTRFAVYQSMCETLANLHNVDVNQVGLSDFGKAGNYFERQVSRWSKQYVMSKTQDIPSMDKLIDWLGTNMVPDDGQVTLVHGDFRLDNMMLHPDEAKVIAVLDWELSTLGHPLADLAYQCMQLRLPANIGHSTGLGGLDRESLGIPSEQAYIESYCRHRGIEKIDNWTFYLAFSFFRLAAIAQGVAKRALDGNASSEQAQKVGDMVEPLAQLACDLIEET